MVSEKFLEEEVEAEVELGVGRQGYELLGEFANGVVHTEEEVEAGTVNIGEPTE